MLSIITNLQSSPDGNPVSSPIVSAYGWDKFEIPSHDASFNKPARLVRLCLKYRGLTSLEPLKKAIIQRLHGAEPTMCSRQEDGAFTLFFELYRPLALPQSQEGAEMVLNAWKNVHGLSKIAGAELDEAHFLSQLVCPTPAGEVEDQQETILRLTDDRMFVERLAEMHAKGTILFDSRILLNHMNDEGWTWESKAEFQPGSIGWLTTPRFGRSRAIVTEDAFIALGSYLSRYEFKAIIGEKNWAEVEDSRQDLALNNSFYYQEMGKEQYALISEGKVRKCTYVEFLACLDSLFHLGGFSAKAMLRDVMVNKKVDGVRNYMYVPSRLIRVDGKTYLNTSDVQLLRPDESSVSDRYGKSCPAINSLLNSLFGAKSEELEVFLSWLALAYQGAYYGRPRRGHAMYIVGAPGTGKTLLRELLGQLFGRSRSGQEFFCENSQFNAYALDDNPLVYLDDASVDWKRCNQMHNRIKELVATGEAFLNGKYEAHRHVEWFGRILVTCNPDGEGRKLIPEIGDDNRDKFIILKTSSRQQEDQNLGANARRELPAFAHFLKHYRSGLMKPALRFGMEAYVSKSVREATLFRDGEGMLLECLVRILGAEGNTSRSQDYTVTELYEKLSKEPSVSGQLSGLCTAKNLGSKINKIREAVENGVVSFPYVIKARRTSARRSWVFAPSHEEYSVEENGNIVA